MSERICLIDGSGYIFRAFFASPPMTNPEGIPVNAVYGFLNMFFNLTNNIKCDKCLVLFDAKRQNYRNEIFNNYKANRPELPADLRPQFDLIHQAVEALNLKWLQMEGFEADDLIATYANLAVKQGLEVVVVTADKDLMQLIRPGVEYYDGMKNRYFNDEDVKEKFGVYPNQVIDVQALAGDSTDNIPGVPGIGIKTAAELVNLFGSLHNVLDNADNIKQNKRRQMIQEHKDDALMSLELVRLKNDVEVCMPLDELTCCAPNPDVLLNFIEKHNFKSLRNKSNNWLKQRCDILPTEANNKSDLEPSLFDNIEPSLFDNIDIPKPIKYATLIEDVAQLDKLKTEILTNKICAFYPHCYNNQLIGISICTTQNSTYFLAMAKQTVAQDLFATPSYSNGLTLDELKTFIEEIFNNSNINIISHDIKANIKTLEALLSLSINLNNYDDVAILAYDINSSSINFDIKTLAMHYFATELEIDKPEYKKTDFSKLENKDLLALFVPIVEIVFNLYNTLSSQLKAEDKEFVYNNIDKPLVKILLEMENNGIKLNTLKLKELDEELNKQLNIISQEIYLEAGEEFNLSSPKQVGEILYTKLGLKGKKHTTGSMNTSAEVLEKMAETHILPQKILDWRQCQKLKSTYTTALLNLMDKNNRVHTTYSQLSTNTGRLSSLNPNLQNIPIRSDVGKEIRKCFIAKENHKIIACDYSQVELRLLGTIANVKFLQDSFNQGVDIHRNTASQVFNVPYNDVDNDLRRRAKAINFGIVYGMSAYGLAKEIGVTPSQAKEYIESYFANMPEVKTYMDTTINFAQENGYVTTDKNRKISIFGIQSSNKALVGFGQRAAINAPIQGGAADIMKLAMIQIYNKLKLGNYKTKMLLQVHDELVFEAPIEEIQQVSQLIKSEMENIQNINLKIPLIAEIGVGDNWGEAH